MNYTICPGKTEYIQKQEAEGIYSFQTKITPRRLVNYCEYKYPYEKYCKKKCKDIKYLF